LGTISDDAAFLRLEPATFLGNTHQKMPEIGDLEKKNEMRDGFSNSVTASVIPFRV
jgi:hypothetical protein